MPSEISAAVVGGLFALLASLIPVLLSGRKTRAAVAAVHDEVKTNHGRRAGEYLEDIPALAKALDDHTAADAQNFEAIRRLIQNPQTAVPEGAA